MTMPYTPILATLGYVMSPNGMEVLLIHRDRREGDQHLGKYNGLGGKIEGGRMSSAACGGRFARRRTWSVPI